MTTTHKETALRFLDYYMRTARLSFDSTGENHSMTPWKIFDKFIKLPENKDLIPLTYNQELEAAQKEIAILVKNNNDLKDKCEELELSK